MRKEQPIDYMNILNLSEKEFEKVKNQLIKEGNIINKPKISQYDEKFFQVVTTSMILVKFVIFFSFFLYALLNLLGIVLSVIYKNFNIISSVIQIIVCVAVLLVCYVIFGNINVNKKTEKESIYLYNDNFIFNFSNGIVETPNLFWSLSCENLHKIEIIVYGTRKKQVYGRVIFIFTVLNYRVTHTINYANITEIKNCIANKYPTLFSKIVIDGKSKRFKESTKDNPKGKTILCAFGCLIASISFFVIPLCFNYFNLALVITGSVLLLTSGMLFLSLSLYAYHLVQGLILCSFFIIIGYCIPLFIIMNSRFPFLEYIASNHLLLLITFFGNIGFCLYLYCIVLLLNKINYLIKSKKDNAGF